MVMLSEARLSLYDHPSAHPSKNEGFAQDDRNFLCRVEAFFDFA